MHGARDVTARFRIGIFNVKLDINGHLKAPPRLD
jgi:hypothetical protein